MSLCMCMIRLHLHIGVVALIGPMSAPVAAPDVGTVDCAAEPDPGMTIDNGLVSVDDELATGVT